jgi:hypothetical protein
VLVALALEAAVEEVLLVDEGEGEEGPVDDDEDGVADALLVVVVVKMRRAPPVGKGMVAVAAAAANTGRAFVPHRINVVEATPTRPMTAFEAGPRAASNATRLRPIISLFFFIKWKKCTTPGGRKCFLLVSRNSQELALSKPRPSKTLPNFHSTRPHFRDNVPFHA